MLTAISMSAIATNGVVPGNNPKKISLWGPLVPFAQFHSAHIHHHSLNFYSLFIKQCLIQNCVRLSSNDLPDIDIYGLICFSKWHFLLCILPLGGSRNSLLCLIRVAQTLWLCRCVSVCKSLFCCCSWRVILHDFTLPGTRVWGGCGTVLLLGHHLCLCHVHPGCNWNLPGQLPKRILNMTSFHCSL